MTANLMASQLSDLIGLLSLQVDAGAHSHKHLQSVASSVPSISLPISAVACGEK
jgi:hypothetical protein